MNHKWQTTLVIKFKSRQMETGHLVFRTLAPMKRRTNMVFVQLFKVGLLWDHCRTLSHDIWALSKSQDSHRSRYIESTPLQLLGLDILFMNNYLLGDFPTTIYGEIKQEILNIKL